MVDQNKEYMSVLCIIINLKKFLSITKKSQNKQTKNINNNNKTNLMVCPITGPFTQIQAVPPSGTSSQRVTIFNYIKHWIKLMGKSQFYFKISTMKH